MRILQVRFKNLNSLVGEWEIDLTHPAFASDGIFAITGPTGSGKTTILDAVCLALYGRTPRLNKVTRSGNEIMSRQTGECFAEVVFETQAGRFRCHWSQRRAHKRPDGEFQAPRHEMADADSGEILESNLKGVADRIEEATGMDFDRFTRSMLLAQGGFAAFLQAPPDDRAPILEQITGMEIYSRISVRVHERRREEREKLNLLQAETAGIAVLAPEREREIRQALADGQKEADELAARTVETGKAIAWLTAIAGLREEIARLEREASELQTEIDAFAPERDGLGRATKAALLEGAYAALVAVRKQQADDLAALKAGEEALPGLGAAVREQDEALKAAERRVVEAKEAVNVAAPLIRKVRSLDQRLADLKKAVSEGEGRCRQDAARIEADRQAQLKEREKRSEAQKALERIQGDLEKHARDAWLIGGLAGVEEQLRGLLDLHRNIVRREDDRRKAATALEQAAKTRERIRKQCEARKRALNDVVNRLRRDRDALSRLLGDRTLRDLRAEKDALLREMAYLARIAELEDHRSRLEDGKPCPLCGAKVHPFAAGNVPVPDETERKIEALSGRIGEAEDREAALRKLEEAEAAARKKVTEAEMGEAAAANDEKAAGQALAAVTEDLEKLRADFAERKRAATDRLVPLGIADIAETQVSSLLESLRARLKAWQDRLEKKAEIERRITELDSGLKGLDAVIRTQSVALTERAERLEALNRELAALRGERNALYGDKQPDDEELRLQRAVSAAEDVERRAGVRRNELLQAWNAAMTRVDALKARLDRRVPELMESEAEFSRALASAGFPDEARFLEARLTAERRDELSQKAKELDDRLTDLKARRQDRETRLAAETARKVTDRPLEALEAQLRQDEQALKGLQDALAGFKHTLRENAAAEERLREKRTAVAAREQECRRWDDLHELIGSADGKKYRNFAQGLSFEIMIGHANRQLEKMTDRYLLIRNDAQPLELDVIDRYQAGEIRSTKNLSGGECFIVSLALALGLSHMAGRKVPVDSLFLDEGFGTLDEEALDTALETLAGLRQDGKLIGVISHVPALTERIGTLIRVTPLTGGRSRISGPGCARVG